MRRSVTGVVARSTLPLVVAIACVLIAPDAVARGHGDDARVEVWPASIPAGGVVRVRGVELGEIGEVVLVLAGAGQRLELGTIELDGEGGFDRPVVIPGAVAPGTYVLETRFSDGDHLDVALAVTAAPLGGGEQRDADEPLLAPVPSPKAGAAGTPKVPGAGDAAGAVGLAAPAIGAMALALLVAVVLVVGLVIGRRA